ncbi:diacylglycerol/lipid kinase family protein [Paracraurococcus ruber]|uniref:Diacylglycerol kinase n=1 Tax=Paracraurococcus ruber TaxID=77675 RepID=A0ABS1CU16_9PROT|nr:diacylglycerol kinase family protein [Paracraurococcus ruber]MBK1657895.1 diacylglycerol kinase [Paracraurococcus ruber]TDG32450.1 diacylglycerol kinase [Paracraurococcus ruber]
MRRVAVVINARSGGLLGRGDPAGEVAGHLRAAGLEAVIVPGDAPDLGARLDRAVALGADAVIVGGGDGSIAAAAQRLAGTGIALGILPLGTMNMLARDLGLPLALADAAAVLARGEVRAIDVAEVNGHAFLCMSVLGLPAAIGRHRERQRGAGGLGGRLRLALGALRALWRHPPLRLDVALDGAPPRRLRTRALAVASNAYAEGFGSFFARERLDRGELVLYRARRFGAWWIARMLAAMALGAWRRQPGIEERPARSITVASRRRALRVMNDGEALLLAPPLRYAIRPRALRVIVPAAAAGVRLPDAAASLA